jgi:hypothetical protein
MVVFQNPRMTLQKQARKFDCSIFFSSDLATNSDRETLRFQLLDSFLDTKNTVFVGAMFPLLTCLKMFYP